MSEQKHLLTPVQVETVKGFLGLNQYQDLPQPFLDLHDELKRMRDKIGAATFTPNELLFILHMSSVKQETSPRIPTPKKADK